MGINKAGYQQVVGALDEYARLVFLPRCRYRQHLQNATIIDYDRMLCEYSIIGINGGAPAGRNEGIAVQHSRRSIPVPEGSASNDFKPSEKP